MFTIQKKFIPITVCLAFGLAACGSDSKSSTTDAAVTTVADTTGATDTNSDDASVADDVKLADSALGQIVVDGEGNTLYAFNNDGPDTPTCTGGCATTWPAIISDDDSGAHVGAGLDESLFKVVSGDNGAQLSFNEHPLYYYAGDSGPGDTNGQGVGGVWFVVGADGNPITG